MTNRDVRSVIDWEAMQCVKTEELMIKYTKKPEIYTARIAGIKNAEEFIIEEKEIKTFEEAYDFIKRFEEMNWDFLEDIEEEGGNTERHRAYIAGIRTLKRRIREMMEY